MLLACNWALVRRGQPRIMLLLLLLLLVVSGDDDAEVEGEGECSATGPPRDKLVYSSSHCGGERVCELCRRRLSSKQLAAVVALRHANVT